jgi:disulfide bond formation protein DsbB
MCPAQRIAVFMILPLAGIVGILKNPFPFFFLATRRLGSGQGNVGGAWTTWTLPLPEDTRYSE